MSEHFPRWRQSCQTVWRYPFKAGTCVWEANSSFDGGWLLSESQMTSGRYSSCIVKRRRAQNITQIIIHASVRAIRMLLEREAWWEMKRNTMKSIEKMKKYCAVCQQASTTTRKFKLTDVTACVGYQHGFHAEQCSIRVSCYSPGIWSDKFLLRLFSPNPVHERSLEPSPAHVVFCVCGCTSISCTRSRLSAAYTPKERWETLKAHGVQLDENPIKTPGTIRTLKIYHVPQRLAYLQIRSEAWAEAGEQESLDLVVLSINYTVRSEALCSALLVFGGILRWLITAPALTQFEMADWSNFQWKKWKKSTRGEKILFDGGKKGQKRAKWWWKLLQLPAGALAHIYRSHSKG